MFRIIKLHDDTTASNQQRLAQIQTILRAQFPGLDIKDSTKLSSQLRNPSKFQFRSVMFLAENAKAEVLGFAILLHLHAGALHFAYLDFISASPGTTGSGIGGALYERVREEARELAVAGLFFECLPDDPLLSPNPEIRKQNAARLKFYERYGARPLANTAYETPISADRTDPPYLVYDDLGTGHSLPRDQTRKIVRIILERKYQDACPPQYVHKVVNSIQDDPVLLRAPRYLKGRSKHSAPLLPRQRRIALIINEKHDIHHVRERGYVQSPVRIKTISRELIPTGLFDVLTAHSYSETHIKAVHDSKFYDYLKRACAKVPEGESVYPYVFPVRNQARPPKELPLRAGYYCIDTFTPLNKNAYLAARGAVDCAMTGASCLLEGYRSAYALVRPPGHHAESRSFGGFCYFNSAAVAAHYLSRHGRVAILDIDYHHGNGTQDIFYTRKDVLTISIHGNPRVTYPYFSGFKDEKGEGAGKGYNLNIPLNEGLDGAQYLTALHTAAVRIRRFAPHFLIISLGLDTAKGDPTGSFTLHSKDFHANGELLGALNLPTLIVQEGGYRTKTLGQNAREFFRGLAATHISKQK